MIELTAQNGEKLAVNPALIWHVRQASGDQTAIYAASGTALFVRETYGDVVMRLSHHYRGSAAND